MKMKRLFNIHLLMLAALCSMAVVLGSCSSEENVPDGTGTSGTNDKNLTTFEAGTPKGTRTSMNPTTGDFFWEEGDRIYVLDDNNNWKGSNAVDAAHAGSSWFKFKVPGKFTAHNTYKVYYPGQMSTNDFARIPAAQTQTKPNTTKHFGMSGDCGVATATRATGERNFNFTLDHQSAILVFQPYTSNTVLHNCYLTKIEVTSNNDITGTYTFNSTTGALIDTGVTTVYNQAVLTTKDPTPGSANEKGFPLTNATASVSTNGAYMLIKPGTHTLRVRYWIKDYTTGTEGTITKNLSSFFYDRNTFYDMTANLDVTEYPGNRYYEWDAIDPYWKGFEWNNANTALRRQPTVNGQVNAADAPQSTFGNSAHTSRDFNDVIGGYTDPTGTAPAVQPSTQHFKDGLLNLNACRWYIAAGDPYWDNELWATMGHLYSGGMWVKKLKKIGEAQTPALTVAQMEATAPDGINYMRSHIDANTSPGNYTANIKTGRPANLSDYFYIPALGIYEHGKALVIGASGIWWANFESGGTKSYSLVLVASPTFFGLSSANREAGYTLWKNGSNEDEYRPNGL